VEIVAERRNLDEEEHRRKQEFCFRKTKQAADYRKGEVPLVPKNITFSAIICFVSSIYQRH